MRMAHGSEQAAGDGWLAVGDAAAFVNPLISPGMTFGVGTSFMAARATVDALNRGVVSRDAFAAYEQYTAEMFSAVKNEVEMLYRGFRHADAYERTLMAKIATVLTAFFGKGRARLEEVKGYTASDAYTLGTLDPDYVDLMQRVIAVQRAGEESGADPADVALMVRGIVDPYIASLLTEEVVKNGEFGRFCTNYTDELVRIEGRIKAPGNYATWRCPTCQAFVNQPFERCMVCGEKRTA
jgi:hypothetical protein